MTKRLKILLIEDNPGDAELIQELLTDVPGIGFDIQWVQSLAQASEQNNESDFDLILADLGLPDSNGLETIESVKRIFNFVPIVVLTGNESVELGLKAVQHGAQDYLIKGDVSGDGIARVSQYAIERFQFQKRLQSSEEKYRSMLENIDLGVYSVSKNFEMTEYNQKMLQWFPWINKNQHEKCFNSVCQSAEANPCTDCPANLVWQDGLIHEKNLVLEVHGKKKYFRLTASPLKNQDGQVVKVFNMLDDVTQRKIMEERLRKTQRMEEIGQLAGGIAHDFNNVLQAIIGCAEMIGDSVPDTDQKMKSLVSEILESTERGSNLTRQLLAYSKRQILKLSEINLNDIVIDLTRMLKRIIGESIEMNLELSDCELKIEADRGQIEQVLVNLCINARHAMDSCGSITIKTEQKSIDKNNIGLYSELKPGDYAVFHVIDTGSGITETDLPYIFDPFFTTKEQGKGTGLGLSTVLGIMKQHGGTINVTSKLNQGSVFTAWLPIIQKSVNQSIFVAEEDQALTVFYEKILRRAGYDVNAITTDSIDESILTEMAKSDCIVVSPLHLALSLDQFIYKIRTLNPTCHFLLILNSLECSADMKFIRKYSIPNLSKPFSADALIKKLETLW